MKNPCRKCRLNANDRTACFVTCKPYFDYVCWVEEDIMSKAGAGGPLPETKIKQAPKPKITQGRCELRVESADLDAVVRSAVSSGHKVSVENGSGHYIVVLEEAQHGTE